MTVIVIRMLALKGFVLPEKAVRDATFYRASTTLCYLRNQGRVVMTGTSNKRRWGME